MLLAVLPPELLGRVVQSYPGSNMEHALEPVRAVRPCNGGNACDAEVVRQLRSLNFGL